MRAKYIEELFPFYFIFGEHSDGRVDISTINGTVCTVSKDDARNILKDRDEVVQKLIDTALAFDKTAPEEFTKFWYGNRL